jgi:ABC-type cobalamin/Fe3+-siderophores transport system ATPase subunit
MTTTVLQDESPGTDPAPVVTAVDVVWRLTAVMGPSGSGKSTLMHSKEA